MESILKTVGHALNEFATQLWQNRIRVVIYVVCMIAAAHFLTPYADEVSNITFVPEVWRFIMPLALALGAGIIAAEILIGASSIIYKRFFLWSGLSDEEILFIAPYIKNNTRTRYIVAYNGTWQDSGTVDLLRRKRIIYLASTVSEYRGEDWMSAEQTFPFNIHADAFRYFNRKKLLPRKLPAGEST